MTYMINKKIYYGKAIYGKEEINASIKVLRNSSLSLMDGKNVKKLEENLRCPSNAGFLPPGLISSRDLRGLWWRGGCLC